MSFSFHNRTFANSKLYLSSSFLLVVVSIGAGIFLISVLSCCDLAGEDSYSSEPNILVSFLPKSPHYYNQTRRRLGILTISLIDPRSEEQKALIDPTAHNVDLNEIEKMLSHCSQHNQILKKPNVISSAFPPPNGKPEFSLTINDYRPRHDHACDTVENLLDAVKTGVRKWDSPVFNSASGPEKENYPSYFVPHTCDIPSISTDQACNILSRYSHLVFVGDSLMRHLRQALFILLRNHGLVRGSIQTSTFIETCQCDGQFSAHGACRLYDEVFNGGSNGEMGVCSNGNFMYKGYVWPDNGYHFWDGIDCADPNQGSILFVVEGGLHYGDNADATYRQLLAPHMSHPQFQKCAIHHKLSPIYIGFYAQSLTLDKPYPAQSRVNGRIFNDQMKAFLQTSEFFMLDVLNFTTDSQSSDGLHKLMDVNLVLMYYIVNLADMLFMSSYETPN